MFNKYFNKPNDALYNFQLIHIINHNCCSERKAIQQRMDVDNDRCAELEAKLRETHSLLRETESRAEEVLNGLIITMGGKFLE
jgi:hypothetical protein